MTEPAPQSLESQVINSLQQMRASYQRIDGLAQQMLNKQAQGRAIQKDMEALKLERDDLAEFQHRTQVVRDAYRKSQSSASKSVRELTDETAILIRNLIVKIAALEEAAKESHRRLIPQIDQNIRGKQMKQAYRGSRP